MALGAQGPVFDPWWCPCFNFSPAWLAQLDELIVYTMPGLGMNFLFFFLSTPEQRTIFTVKKKTGHNICLVKSWIPSSFV